MPYIQQVGHAAHKNKNEEHSGAYWIVGLCLFYSLLSFFSLRPSDFIVEASQYQEDRSPNVYGLQRGGGRPLHRNHNNITNDYNNHTSYPSTSTATTTTTKATSSFNAPSHCTVVQLRAIQDMLPDSETIKMNTNCPDSSSWMMMEEDYSSSSPHNHLHRPLAVFVGCNKGLDAINALRMLSLNNPPAISIWCLNFPSTRTRFVVVLYVPTQKSIASKPCPAPIQNSTEPRIRWVGTNRFESIMPQYSIRITTPYSFPTPLWGQNIWGFLPVCKNDGNATVRT
jgi:hypothetical protein